MPKFFLPGTHSPEDAEEIWQATKKSCGEQTGWQVTDRRIFRIEYTHNGKDYVAEVGQIAPEQGETVLVILESNAFLVCTTNRGVLRGKPMPTGNVRNVIDFDSTADG